MKADEVSVVKEVDPHSENLELVVIEKTVGSLDTNIEWLEELVEKRLEDYRPENYKGDADLAKKDRAELNKAKDTLKQKRKEIISELMKPYENFEERCKNLEKKIEQASKALDEIVKLREESEKSEKRKLIELFWEKQNCTVVPLEKIFNPKWLNKTFKESDILKEMETAVQKIYDNLKTLERFSDDAEVLKAHYLMTLDIEETFQYGDELQRQKEVAKQESEERSEREHTAIIDKQKNEVWQEEKQLAEKQEVENLASEALSAVSGQEVQQVRKQFVVTVNCFEGELLKLKEAMNSLGIEFSVQELTF